MRFFTQLITFSLFLAIYNARHWVNNKKIGDL